jgi:ABC-2 type transport system ATP-binding protein
MTARAIQVEDLTMTYGELRAADGVSLEVAEGAFVGILGSNGAGKTTTLETIEGLRQPDSGTVTVLGLPVWPRNPALLLRMGVQLQASSFFERLTVREQIHTFAALYGGGTKPADEWMGRVGLEDKADTRVEDLSGGQTQRSPSRSPWCTTPTWSSSTSRPPRWTRRRAATCGTCSRGSTTPAAPSS